MDALQKLYESRGEEAKDWIKEIPQKILYYEQKWSIKVGDPFSLSYNFAAPAIRKDGTPVVIKIAYPKDPESFTEIAALELFHGDGAVLLLDEDKVNAVALLEHVLPGTTLKEETDDQKATKIAASIAKKLARAVSNKKDFILLEDWFKGYERYKQHYKTNGPIPYSLFTIGYDFSKKLLSTTKNPHLLHGDLHHTNILSATRQPWVAIDPKGVIGDLAYEPAAFLRNPYPEFLQRLDPKKDIEQRVNIFAKDLELDRQRIIQWGIAQCILSAIWEIEEDGKGWEYDIRCAQLLLAL